MRASRPQLLLGCLVVYLFMTAAMCIFPEHCDFGICMRAHANGDDPDVDAIRRVVLNVTGAESYEVTIDQGPPLGWFKRDGEESWTYAPAAYDGQTLVCTTTGYDDQGRPRVLGRVEIERREKQIIDFDMVPSAQ